jgi:hypothetical protein
MHELNIQGNSGLEIEKPAAGEPFSEAVLNRLVYVVGPARSGTTMLHRMMKFHPNLLSVGKTVNFYSYFWRYHRRIDRRMLNLIFHSYEWFRWSSIRDRFGAEFTDILRKQIDNGIRNEDLRSLFSAYPIAYAASGESQKNEDKIRAWEIKSNDDECWDDIIREFPLAKFVIIIRDPRSTVYSQIKRIDSVVSGEKNKIQKLCQTCLYWNYFASKAYKFERLHPDNTMLLKYEDLINEPETMLNRIFEFSVGTTMSKEQLSAHLQKMHGVATNDQGEHYEGVSKKPLTRWKDGLKSADVALIENITGRISQQFGYDIPARSFGPFRAIGALSGIFPRLQFSARLLKSYIRIGRIC